MNGSRSRLARWGRTVLAAALLGAALWFGGQHVLRSMYPVHYWESVQAHAAEHSLDPLLITAVIYVESNFDRYAVSPRGARGLMQIMPETGQWVAERIGLEEFDPGMLFEPDVNVSIGTWYLADLIQLFDGNTIVALAAYNGGRGNVRRWLNEASWSGEYEEVEDIPFPETRAFVQKVLRVHSMYRWLWEDRLARGYVPRGNVH